MNKKNTVLFSIILLLSCASQKNTVSNEMKPADNLIPDGKLFTALFQQRAAEYRALCYQAYNIAHLRLDEMVKQQYTKPLAVVTDIDETALDNSPYAVHQGLLGKDYDPVTWLQWTDKAIADTVPGACTFFKYAASKNVEVFYVTNRSEKERASTLKNLQLYSFPNADSAHLLLRHDVSSKEVRRQSILQTHEIILLLGDNLADLNSLYDEKKYETRLSSTQTLASEFGNKFIVLPNPNYGDWESAIYSSKMTTQQKDSAIKSRLISF